MWWEKLLVVITIITGESLMIASQIWGAQATTKATSFFSNLLPNHWYIWATLLGGLIILTGYFYGITILKNIWLVTITSWTGVVIAEVLFASVVFKSWPSGQVLIGFLLVLTGFTLANFE